MKKILSAALTAIIILNSAFSSLAAEYGFSNFAYADTYIEGQFSDVTGSAWYSRYVRAAYNFGFMQGKSPSVFDPGGLITLGEAVTVAARLSSIYKTGSADFVEIEPYFEVYAGYALENNIIDKHGDYTQAATRAQFAKLIYNALPQEALPVINDIPDYAICDTAPDNPDYGDAAYTLYRAGILTGSDRYGFFLPGSNITRAEVCAILARLANPAERVSVALPKALPGEAIYGSCIDSVLLLETYDEDGESIRTAGAFFIDDTGLAATNLHVFENAVRAIVTLNNGRSYPVAGINASSTDTNTAIFTVDLEDEPVRGLTLYDSDLLEAGSDVFVLGNPMGLQGTISSGIIANTLRELSGVNYFQMTAPISFGSGGSPVLNARGQVVGIASSSYTAGQNLNLAIPINAVKELKIGGCKPIPSVFE